MSSKPTVTKYPEIGLDSARMHLHEVLSPAYQRFTERGTRANLLQVAEAAWEIHERLWRDKGVRRLCRSLGTPCSRLAPSCG
jgi:hypothetical protein